MDPNQDIQRAIGTRSNNSSKARDIQPVISSTISDRAEQTVRESGQYLSSESFDPAGKHYLFRILQTNKDVERVVVEWFIVSSIPPPS